MDHCWNEYHIHGNRYIAYSKVVDVYNSVYTIHVGTVGPALVKLIGSKFSLILATSLFLIYAVLNYYPHWGTLVPGAVVLGLVGLSTIWTAMFTHATATAIKYAPALKETSQHTIPLFLGAVGLSVKLALVLGSGISAATLWNFHVSSEANSSNGTSDEDVCDNDSASQLENNYIYYVLITVYMISCFIAIFIIMVTVDHYGTESQFMSAQKMLKVFFLQPTKDAIKLSVDWKMVCLIPLAWANGSMLGTIFSLYPKVCSSATVG